MSGSQRESVGVYIGDGLRSYAFPDDHSFGEGRLDSFWSQAVKTGLNLKVEVLAPEIANEAELAIFHSEEYIELLKHKSKVGTGFLDLGDTPAFPGIFEAASYIVGSGLNAVDRLIRGEYKRIFIPIAGLHHCRQGAAAGFCAISDLGVMIKVLRQKHGIQRIAYVDIDAHHGDGVFYSFEDDPDLIFADIHEDGRFLYPGTGFSYEVGKGEAKGTKLNIPVFPGSRDDTFFRSWGKIEEFLRHFRPEIIIFQAGADSIKGDPITDMEFTPAAHGHAARQLCKIADEFCNGKLIATGGGGYNPRNIAYGWCAVLEEMINT